MNFLDEKIIDTDIINTYIRIIYTEEGSIMDSNNCLAALRKQAGLTQADLAQHLGITQGQVSKYEESGEIPSRLVKRWAGVLGVTTDDLLPGDDEPVDLPPFFDFDDSLYADLTENLHLLQQYIDRFPNLEKTSESEDGLATVAQFRDRVTALAEKPWVVITGHFDAGKSHLCNFYLNRSYLPATYRPTTKYPTFVHHSSDRPDWFKEDLWLMGPAFEPEKWHDEQHCSQNRRLAGSWDTLKQYATLQNADSTDEDGSVLAFIDAPLLHSCVLVDLPGYDDTKIKATLIDEAGKRASVLLYVCRAQGFLDGGDFQRLGYLLRSIPHYEASDESFPSLGNLFIIASHAHGGIKTDQLNTQILDGGAREFYKHFEGNLFKELETQMGRTIQDKDVAARFCSFWQEAPSRRKKLENGLGTLLETHLPRIKEKSAEQKIRQFKKEGAAGYAKHIAEYERILGEKREAKRFSEKLEEAEPARKREHDTRVERVTHKITSSKERDLKRVRTVFQTKTKIENLEAMIKRRYTNKKDAQKLAAGYVLEEIQSKTARFRQGLVDGLKDTIEQFLEDDAQHMEKFSDAAPGEEGRLSFDAKAAFLGGLTGLGSLGALGAWAATLGNLGGYIIVSKVAAALGLSSLTAAGAAGPTGIVAALGGPVVLAAALAIITGLAVWRLFAGSWQYRLAKKIREAFEEKRVLSQLEDKVRSFWDETVTAFQKGADNLDKTHKKYLEELCAAFGGSQENLEVLERRLKRYEELKSFFASIPWRSRTEKKGKEDSRNTLARSAAPARMAMA